GMSFTETVRSIRMEKIKRLLIDSELKLNQIADMAGYSDPKYMSKVFKEETGMLPAEYRKMNK
ncbi:MAG: helix-turn-helix transcriptional regulator, partial [Lachnospiraceae bacterium]